MNTDSPTYHPLNHHHHHHHHNTTTTTTTLWQVSRGKEWLGRASAHSGAVGVHCHGARAHRPPGASSVSVVAVVVVLVVLLLLSCCPVVVVVVVVGGGGGGAVVVFVWWSSSPPPPPPPLLLPPPPRFDVDFSPRVHARVHLIAPYEARNSKRSPKTRKHELPEKVPL